MRKQADRAVIAKAFDMLRASASLPAGRAIDGNLTSAGSLDIDTTLSSTLAAPILRGHLRGGGWPSA